MIIPPVTLTPNARTVPAQRYLYTDEQGHVVETPEDMVLRVARLLASVDQRYDPHLDVERQTVQYATVMAERLMRTITAVARQRSYELGQTRGSFPSFAGSRWAQQGYRAMRNATVTTIAPTGTLSILAGTSSGIEPLFAVAYVRQALDGTVLPEVNPYFQRAIQAAGLETDTLVEAITRCGSLQQLTAVPEPLRGLFVTALDIPPAWHVRMQAAFQRHTDNAVSKTANLPSTASLADVDTIYRLAYTLGCKGMTVYRDGSRAHQVLSQGNIPGISRTSGTSTAHAEYSGECRLCSV